MGAGSYFGREICQLAHIFATQLHKMTPQSFIMCAEHAKSGGSETVTARLANRLTQARRQRFVGPGGMGKTTLLREFAHIAEQVGRPLPSPSMAN